MIKILVVEDDVNLNQLISSTLKKSGYCVIEAFDGQEALDCLEEHTISLILSDIMMPKMDGFNFASRVRENDKQIPILFMSARDDKFSKHMGYNAGIDDYIVKPFDIDELVLKVKAILRRMSISDVQRISIGNLIMNEEERTVYINQREVNFTVREFDILFKLLSYPKKTFTRTALMDEFWDFDSSATSRTVDVYMAKIRDKTSDCDGFEIVTVHGLGYKVVVK